jgi:hypothetical protein
MVATTRLCDPLWAFVLGDYDDYYDDEATVKLKDESREPEQQGKEEHEEASITSQAAKSKAAKNKVEQNSDPSSDDEEVKQYFLGPGDHAEKQTKRSKKIFRKRQKKLASTQVRLKEVDGKETLQADGGEWRLFGDMPIPSKEDVETFKAQRKASLLEERTQEPPVEIIVTKKEEPTESLAFIHWWKLKSRENSETNDGSNRRNVKFGVHSSGSIIEDGILGGADMDSFVGGAKDFDREASVIDLTVLAVKRDCGIMDDDNIQSVEEEELQAKSSKDINEKLGPLEQKKRGDLQGKSTEESINADGPALEGSDQGSDRSDDEHRLLSLSLPHKTSSTLEGSGQRSDQSDDEHRLLSLSLPKKPSSDLNRVAHDLFATKSIKDDAEVRANLPKPPQPMPRQGFLGGLAARRNIHKFNRHLLLRSDMETATGRDRAIDSEGSSKLVDEPVGVTNRKGQLRHSTASLGSNKMSGSAAKAHQANSLNTRADRKERTTVQFESDARPRSNRAKYLKKVEDPRYRNARPGSHPRDTRSDPFARNRESEGYRNLQPAEFEYYDVTMMDDEYSYEDALENRRTLPASVQREIDANVSKRRSASKEEQLRTDGPGHLRNPTNVDSKQRDRLSNAERLQYLRTSARKSNENETQQRLSYPDLLEAGPSFGMIPSGSFRLG